jgi:SAM-dependent methyltransferase
MTPADWQLPPGVSRGLWDYLHDADLARGYDASLSGTPLLAADLAFAGQHFPRPGRLIDLGCGTGRLLVPFAQRGFRVLGVDLSAEMLSVARDKAAAAGVTVDLVQANIVALEGITSGAFDYAACLFSTLGMVTGPEARRRVVGHAYRVLRPGGRFVLHVHNRWFHFWDPEGRKWLARDAVRSLTGDPGAGDRAMPAHRGIAGLSLHHFTRREAVRLLRREGFRIDEVRPVGLGADGRLRWPWWLGWLRAYGYLIAAERPG